MIHIKGLRTERIVCYTTDFRKHKDKIGLVLKREKHKTKKSQNTVLVFNQAFNEKIIK